MPYYHKKNRSNIGNDRDNSDNKTDNRNDNRNRNNPPPLASAINGLISSLVAPQNNPHKHNKKDKDKRSKDEKRKHLIEEFKKSDDGKKWAREFYEKEKLAKKAAVNKIIDDHKKEIVQNYSKYRDINDTWLTISFYSGMFLINCILDYYLLSGIYSKFDFEIDKINFASISWFFRATVLIFLLYIGIFFKNVYQDHLVLCRTGADRLFVGQDIKIKTKKHVNGCELALAEKVLDKVSAANSKSGFAYFYEVVDIWLMYKRIKFASRYNIGRI